MTNRDEYVEKLKAQLDQWNSQLATWEAATREARADAKIELEKQVGILRSRIDDQVFRMGLVKDASAEAWEEIARGADEARKTMQDAFEKARLHYKDL